MSGAQTIRDVVVRLAVEMANSEIKVPDFSQHKRAIDDLEKYAKDKFKSINEHWEGSRGTAPFSGTSAGGSQSRGGSISVSDVGDGLDDIRQQFAALKEAASGLAKDQKTLTMASGEAGAGIQSLVAVLTKLPPQAQIAIAAVAAVGAAVGGYNAYRSVNRDYMASQLNPAEMLGRGINVNHMGIDNAIQRDTQFGATPFQFQMPNGASWRPETSFEGWTRWAGGKFQGLSDFFTGLGEEDDLRNKYSSLANDQLKVQRFQEMRGTSEEIRRHRSASHAKDQQAAFNREFGFSTTGDQMHALNAREAEHSKWLTSEMDKPGVVGGVRGAQLNEENARAGVEFAKQRLQLQQQLISELEREKDAYGKVLQSAQQTLQAEQERLRGEKERIGAASGQDLARLNAIGKKLEKGEKINDEEAKLASHYGLKGADNQIGKHYEERFNKGLSAEAQRGFGIGNDMKKAQQDVDAARRNYDDATPEIDSEIESTKESAKALIEKWPDLIKAQDEANQATKEGIEALMKAFRELSTEVQKAAQQIQTVKTGMQQRNVAGF